MSNSLHAHNTYFACVQVGDELLEINGNTTEGMLHSDAITIIKHGGDSVKLTIRRVLEEQFIGCKWQVFTVDDTLPETFYFIFIFFIFFIFFYQQHNIDSSL